MHTSIYYTYTIDYGSVNYIYTCHKIDKYYILIQMNKFLNYLRASSLQLLILRLNEEGVPALVS